MNTDPSGQDRQRKSLLYFTFSSVSFLLMGFLWALDPSFVYIFAGSGVFFAFLSIYNYPWKESFQSSASPFKKSQSGPHSSRPVFSADKKRRIRIATIIAVVILLLPFLIIGFFAGDDNALAEGHFYRAEDFRNRNENDSARFFYRKALQYNPEYVDAWNNYGITWHNEERYDSALYMFDKAIALDEENESARYNKALVYFYQKDHRRSLAEDFALLNDSPDYNEARQLAGDNYYSQKNYDSALYWYDQAYAKGFRTAWLCHVMGYLYDIKGDTQNAINLYQEAVSYDANKKDVFTRLGELLPGNEGEQYRIKAAQLEKDGY